MAAVRTLAVLATLVVALGACNDDGRSLAPAPEVPPSLATTTTAVVGPDAGGFTVDPVGLVLLSPAFENGAPLDAAFTCDGLDVPPPLTIIGLPDGTAESAVVVTDRDADGYVHWVLAGVPPSVTNLEAGLIPPGAVTARTDSGVDGWDGPCPPRGEAAHHYEFTVYAMVGPIGLAAGLDAEEAIALIERAAVASASVTATYTRPAAG